MTVTVFRSIAAALTIGSSTGDFVVMLLKLSRTIDDLVAPILRTFGISSQPASFGCFPNRPFWRFNPHFWIKSFVS
jgi:hypothetical protein